MAIRTDLMVLSNGDLDLGAKTLGTVPSDNTHIMNLLNAAPGSWKQFLQNGVNVQRYLKATGTTLLVLKKEARKQLVADGYVVQGDIKFKDNGSNTLTIEATITR